MIWIVSNVYEPAAKCNGVDLRPAVSLAFTVCELINFFTLIISPVLHASNNSRSGSFAITTSKFTDKVRLRLDISLYLLSRWLQLVSFVLCYFFLNIYDWNQWNSVNFWQPKKEPFQNREPTNVPVLTALWYEHFCTKALLTISQTIYSNNNNNWMTSTW